MNTSDTWNLIEGKMLELRISTNANWKNQEYEVAPLRTVEIAKAESERMRSDLGNLTQSVDELKNEWHSGISSRLRIKGVLLARSPSFVIPASGRIYTQFRITDE